MKKFKTAIFLICAFCMVLCGCDETYTTTWLNTNVDLNIENAQDIKEVYDKVNIAYGEELSEHTLTKVFAAYSSNFGEEPMFKVFTFEFCKDEINWKNEQIISAITICYDVEEKIVNGAKKFLGTAKAYSGTGLVLSKDVLEAFNQLIINEEMKNPKLEQITNKKIKIWSNIYGEQVYSIVEASE